MSPSTPPTVRPRVHVLGAALAALFAAPLAAQTTRTYTSTADFGEGTLTNVNTLVADQLQLDPGTTGMAVPLINVPASGRGTLIRVDGNTGQVVGEYRTAPQARATNPSRTAIDAFGNVWVGNRDESSSVPGLGPRGSVVKIGVCVGGTRTDQFGNPDPLGEYLKPPFAYSTCVDRNGDGLIRTSRGLGQALPWPDVTDGVGGADGIVQDAFDEAILVYQRTNGLNVRHLSIADNDRLWVGGFPLVSDDFDLLAGPTGSILQTLVNPLCGGHGGVTGPGGIVWSTTGEGGTKLMRFDTGSQLVQCIDLTATSPNNSGANHGLGLGPDGSVWVTQFDLDQVLRFMPDGSLAPGFPKPTFGSTLDRSVAISPFDGNAWVDGSGGSDVTRLDANGNFLKVVPLGGDGLSPRGMAVDSTHHIWTTCLVSNTVKRIDPHGDVDGLGIVDMTVPLGRAARPYAFNNFISEVGLPPTTPIGTWRVLYDSMVMGNEYGRISWTESVPSGSAIVVEYRTGDDPAGLPGLPWTPAQNGLDFTGVFGRYVEVRVTFTRQLGSPATPVLFDLTIRGLPPPEPIDCPTGRREPASLLVFPEFDSRPGDLTLLTVTNTSDDFTEVGNQLAGTVKVEFVYIGRYGDHGQPIPCLEFNRTHTLTPNDTLSVVAGVHNPDHEQGFVYVFAKSPITGEAIVHNFLVGTAVVLRSFDDVDYGYNPYAFLGIGERGAPTDHDLDGVRDLNGVEYTCVGDQLLVPRFFGQAEPFGLGLQNGYRSDLVLVNLTGGAQFTAVVDLLVYNDAEEVFSTQTSFDCWDRQSLYAIDGAFSHQFLQMTNNDPQEVFGATGIETGWFRIDGSVAHSFARAFPDPALLAMLVERMPGSRAACDLPFEEGAQTNGDLYVFGVFGDLTP